MSKFVPIPARIYIEVSQEDRDYFSSTVPHGLRGKLLGMIFADVLKEMKKNPSEFIGKVASREMKGMEVLNLEA